MSETLTKNFTVTGLDCAECARTLEQGVAALGGVRKAEVNFTLARLTLDFDPQETDERAVVARVRELGYDVEASAQERRGAWATVRRYRDVALAGTAGVLIALAFTLHLIGVPEVASHALYIVATVAAGYMSARAAWASLRTVRTLDMNVLMMLAAAGALAIGEFEEGAVVTFLFALGNLLEGYTLDRARNAIRALMDLTPPQATRLPPLSSPPLAGGIEGGQEEVVPVEALVIGDRIVVRPGERIPMDGRVLEGASAVNQAPITGEGLPVEKHPSDEAFAGTVNGSGALVIEVTRLAQDNTLARIIQMVEEAQAQKAPSQRFVDRFARIYTPAVVVGALLIAVAPPLVGLGAFVDWLYRALVLLVIACPCALVISTPVTIVSGIARAARAGVLIKGGVYLEQAGALRVVAFDKTGTLTQGRPVVVAGRCGDHDDGASPETCPNCRDLLALAAAVEARSEHPLAQAIIEQARAFGVEDTYAPAESVEALAGMGVRGRVAGHDVTVGSHTHIHGDTHLASFCGEVAEATAKGQTVALVKDACCGRQGYVAVADALREAAPQVIAELRRAGIQRTVMLTGDGEDAARAIAAQVGVDESRAGLLPEQKVEAVEGLLARYGHVAMVGDGINDAPALARASVGIVMGAAGSDAALETADIALMGDDLTRLPFTMRLSRRALSIIRQNIAFALLIKAVFLALALAGAATLWMAVFADMGASLLVTLNGMRVLGYREK
ncbi:MAG: heavy metal translocating P-type ATPase [Anaerolineae bacterium]|nr:heavy metal translocating P-type ATPase [Anaerolineae bacterium]